MKISIDVEFRVELEISNKMTIEGAVTRKLYVLSKSTAVRIKNQTVLHWEPSEPIED